MIADEKVIELYDKNCNAGFEYSYGTAGFRHKADILDTVMFSTGVLACLRSMYLKSKYVGVMITASHNPAQDNGVKLVDPKGEMLKQEWEVHATRLANAASKGKYPFISRMKELMSELNIQDDVLASIVVARDSRESGPRLLKKLTEGTRVFSNVKIRDFGMLTTPQLHFLTYQCNHLKDITKLNEQLYYTHFISAWESLAQLYNIDAMPYPLVVDTANGVGGLKVAEIFTKNEFFKSAKIINNNWFNFNLLNSECGADYVKTNQCLPTGIPECMPPNSLCCSFDGDADRVVFYYLDTLNKFHLLDGDKISTLFAKFFQYILSRTGIQDDIRLGVVQTAYANGSSTKYLTNILKVPVSCTPTGVKHLHSEAVKSYDIGIYFEANGHGTVIFSDKFNTIVKKRLAEKKLSDDTNLALKTMYLLSKLINQTIGDAISDMMAVLIILCILNWTPEQWNKEYCDLPSRLHKTVVPNRSVFKTTNAERRLISPVGLQDQIDRVLVAYDDARLFVRASGTEDAVRIYTEASTKLQADELCKKVGDLVIKATSVSS